MTRSAGGGGADFFISYTAADQQWAEWIAVTLEGAGHSTVLQSFDIRPGADFVHEMQRATASAARTIAVLSPAYLRSPFGEAEWRSAFARDPSGERGVLVPVLVEPCEPLGLLSTRVRIELAGLDEAAARRVLLTGVGPAERPESAPYPASAGATGTRSAFPGARSRSGTSPGRPGRIRFPSASGPAAALSVLLAALVVMISADGGSTTVWPAVRGTVSCTSGAPVQGVWLDATNGPQGFVGSLNRNRLTGRTVFDYGTSPVAGYQLRVGCGGTEQEWAVKASTPVVARPVVDFVCDDDPSSPRFATCDEDTTAPG